MSETEIDRAEFFERAADVIRTYGHTKGSLWEGNEDNNSLAWRLEDGLPEGWDQAPVCAWGAMYVVGGQMLPNSGDKLTAIGRLGQEVTEHITGAKSPMALANWNDVAERSADEVIDGFLGLAKDIRNGER